MQHFINSLVERYGKPKSDFVINDIKYYFNEYKDNIDFDDFYSQFVQQYEYESFPNVAKLKIFHGKMYFKTNKDFHYDYDYASCMDGKEVEEICAMVFNFRNRSGELKSYEIDLVYKWDKLSYLYGMLTDAKKDKAYIIRQCTRMRDKIINNEPIELSSLPSRHDNIESKLEKIFPTNRKS